jgi:type II secretory pathway pseudopilin PulG
MDNSAVLVALIVAISSTIISIVSPILVSFLQNRTRRQEKAEDYARQDAVAQKAAEAAKLLLAANERVAANAVQTMSKLDDIHTLVNSNLTTAMRAELDATTRELAVMSELIDLKRASGHEPSVDAMAAIKATKAKVSELSAVLKDRLNISAQ